MPLASAPITRRKVTEGAGRADLADGYLSESMPLRVLETRSLTRWDGLYRVRPDDKPMTNDQGPTAGTDDQACDLLLPV